MQAYAPADAGAAGDAIDTVDKAVRVVHQMEGVPDMANLLKRAKGIGVVPEYGRGALVAGGRGGAGVLLVRRGRAWSNPAFYTMGGVSIGVQPSGEGGAIALVPNAWKGMRHR